LHSLKPKVQITIDLDRLNFLMDTSYCKEQPKKQEGIARRKVVKKRQEVETQAQAVLTLALSQIIKFIERL
jgi:hypothetical protein